MGIVFEILRIPFMNKLMTYIYIRKNRQRYLSVVESSDDVIVLCDGQKLELEKMCGIHQIDKVKIIPNCQEPSDINLSLEKKEKIVLWAGTFDYAIKRPDYMLCIWEKVAVNYPDWKLIMLGDGPSWKRIKRMAKEMNLQNIEIVGRVSPSTYYRKASLLCVTSVHESFSLVITEAHSYGVVPIVFNSFSAAPIVVEDNVDGILVPPFSIKKFAEELCCLMRDENRRRSMSIASVDNVKKFGPDRILNMWSKIISFV